ncbi:MULTISPECIES: RNA polymerase sigma factor [Corynebacterium]|jgi:RNA polymerase sigma factor, sigma-70 family|uniref:Sigma-70 family RNA polymerase sigma factor n=1 Tax=Corynebacterium pseudodiphtheriticum TaxID=37637 RepID=A0ABT7FU14_9CORY|nr:MULTISPECIES: sigma-70 family RNA polymerase sigma factor [Corynebacterium]ERJ44051.1 RNA polymerase sigma factor [Corynebacterium pseudodiphtheriticum 090104]ERS40104.1 hypothetical protein HMPREF1292_00591 [Corynebacterium sp. KPL1995]ERS74301.1 hypothetical protein HMPREF1290_00592 [Corynebacterium sp. KPL1989]MCG7252718.1 sigma-70 family RNA polymerase sigma factor [Corynebacterium pseudodiphtheriticum]MDC7068612.1 sigma-70 family RNA polymerase sigma factor [Corynebacterium pseudodipht
MTEHTEISDQQLVDDFCSGDASAFNAIFTKHRRRLRGVARRYAGNDHDIDDIMQDAMLKASTKLDTYRAESALSTWLHRLVMNAGYDYLNHKHRRETPTIDAEVVPHDHNPALGYDPAGSVDARIYLQDALAELAEEQREALTLTDIAGYSIFEVAKQQGVAPGTVKSRRWRARQAIRDAVERAQTG